MVRGLNCHMTCPGLVQGTRLNCWIGCSITSRKIGKYYLKTEAIGFGRIEKLTCRGLVRGIYVCHH